MKRILLFLCLISVFAGVMLCTAAAEETSAYGYYDYNEDGIVGLTDAFSMLRIKLQKADSDITLLRVLRSLKATVNSKTVTGTITKVADSSFTLKTSSGALLSAPCEVFGIPAADDLLSYKDLSFTATVPAEDTAALLFYAGKVDRDRNRVITVTADSKTAYVGCNTLQLDAAPILTSGELLTPMHFVAENFGAVITWEDETTVCLTRGETVLQLPMDSTTVYVNGNILTAGTPATMRDGYTYLPLTLVAEVFGASCTWDADGKTVTAIEQPKAEMIIEDATATAGSTVRIPIVIRNCPGIAGLQIEMHYDSNAMSFTSGIAGSGSFHTSFSAQNANPAKVVLANLSLKEIPGTIKVATLTFTVHEDTVPGIYALSVKKMEAYDADVITVPVTIDSCTVTIE